MISILYLAKVFISCKTAITIHAKEIQFNWNEKKQHTDLSKWIINQWTWHKIIISSQKYKIITSRKTTNNIPAIIIQM